MDQDRSGSEELERLASTPTGELLSELAKGGTELVKKEVELAKAELREDIQHETKAGTELGIAVGLGLSALNALFVAAIFGLGRWIPEWETALVIAGTVFTMAVIVGAAGWAKRVRKPLEKTQATMKENVEWVKERFT